MQAGRFAEREFRGPDGTRFAYVDEGGGSPILLLHGWSSSLRWFDRNIADLAREHRVVAFDFRGHGSSEKAELGHTMARYAQDVRDLVDGLELGRPVMAGWSMGSIVLWSYIQQFGQGQAAGMVFVGQSASDLITPDYEHGIMTMDDLEQWMTDLQTDREPFVRGNMQAMVKNPPPPAELDWMTSDYLRTPGATAALVLYMQTVANSVPAFRQIDFPTQVYFGVDPKMYRIEHGHWLADAIPGTELVIFEESGHVPMREEPGKFNAELHRFTERVA
jgi:pimeloyl-ACP methyl ester carboxylesterase